MAESSTGTDELVAGMDRLTTGPSTGHEKCIVIVGNDSGTNDIQIPPDVITISLERRDHVSSKRIPALPTTMQFQSVACSLGTTLYVTGVGEGRTETCKWEQQAGWTRCADMRTAGRRRYCLATVGNSLYVLGGVVERVDGSGFQTLDSVDKYDTEDDTWSTTVGRLNTATCFAACAAYQECIYVFGGRAQEQHQMPGMQGKSGSLGCIQVFDTATNQCSTLGLNLLPEPRQMLMPVVLDKYVVLIGKTATHLFDFELGNIQRRGQISTGAHQFGAVLDNQRIYVFGGHSKAGRGHCVERHATDEVRSISVTSIINNEPAQWIRHATLPQPAFIHAFAVVTLPTD